MSTKSNLSFLPWDKDSLLENPCIALKFTLPLKLNDLEFHPVNQVEQALVIRNIRNMDGVRGNLIHKGIIKESEQVKWFWQTYMPNPEHLIFLVCNSLYNIGYVQCTFHNLDQGFDLVECEWGFAVAENFQNKGFGTTMSKFAVQFSTHFLNRIFKMRNFYLQVFSENKIAIRVYLKTGWIVTKIISYPKIVNLTYYMHYYLNNNVPNEILVMTPETSGLSKV